MLRGVNGSGGGAPVGGSGTSSPSTIPRWTGASTLGDSRATDDGTTFVVGSGAYAGTALPGGMQLKTTVPIYVATDGTRTTIIGTDGTTSCFVGSLTNHNFQIRASNATAITVLPAGNVGIGTASPVGALSIYRAAGVDAYVELSGGGRVLGSKSVFYGQDAAGSAYVWNRENQPVYIGTNATVRAAFGASQLDISQTTGYGLKLPATPGNADAQTLDCYQDGGASAGGLSWTPTLSAAATWGGTAPTVTNARYTRIGNLVFCTVTLDATGAVAFSSTYGSSTISSPAGLSATASTTVPSNRAGVSANGAQGGTTVYVPTYASNTTVINLTWFFAV